MKKKTADALYSLGYRQGYEQAQRDAEQKRRYDRDLEAAYRKGQMAEAKANGDTRRTIDLMGGANE